ncbi:aminotransferase class IV [Paenibacillus sp. LHD-117]|uniref:aminotransferase class IV n=1 Tax=Paenibacillus sp. LHD-117 TaxID=3071412 RepID=UPI0027E123CA|nr:aminotransferase class IV [Paenibacillus sp. LHD-117]MDQ6420698.1 aminotransferase class IV [Paenibacillus sp. LHD-117]
MNVWLNGRIVDGGEAVISVYDHGFLYGLGLFETFRTYGGEPYLLERHLERLRSGCDELGIPFDMEGAELRLRVRELLAVNGLADGYVRLTVSAGDGELGLPAGDYARPTVLLLVKALPATSDETLRRGRELRLLRTRRNTPEGQVRFKSLHYMNNILAKREMLGLTRGEDRAALRSDPDAVRQLTEHGAGMSQPESGAEPQLPERGSNSGQLAPSGNRVQDAEDVDPLLSSHSAASEGPSPMVADQEQAVSSLPSPGAEGLMLSREGWLAEGIVSNLFFLRDGTVCTPSIATGILPGVTRARVLELAQESGCKVEEGLYSWEELLEADEVWLTNSIQELVPVTVLSDWDGFERKVGGGEAGPLTMRLLAMYRADTGSATL